MSGLRFGGRVPMYAENSDLDESPRHSRLQGMLPSRHGGGPHIGNDGETSDFEEFPPRTRHRGHGMSPFGGEPHFGNDGEASAFEDLPPNTRHQRRRPSRHGGRAPGSRFGGPNMFGPQGLGSGIANGGFGEHELAISPRGHRHDHRAGLGARVVPDFNPRGLHGDLGDELGDDSTDDDSMDRTRHPGGVRGFGARDQHGDIDDEDSDVELRRLFGMGGPGRRGAIDGGRRGQGRRGTMEHGRDEFGLGDLDLGDRGFGSRHGPGRRHGSAHHGHREHREMDGHGGNARRLGRH
ncbi:hypothetical protein N7G274_009654 [Stereocaulon virgatum]|uniref:Uncharacterized protein n=1 Tax=Stereocaulon virgatum TaxID=373712 RepID=A0ABR3ZVA5_9LECA